jgi:hypothetical protein
MIAIQIIMEPVFEGEDHANEVAGGMRKRWRAKHAGSIAWLNSIEEKISDEMAPWFAWPISQRDAARARIVEQTLAHNQALLKEF